jgi:hypothetical protein
VLLAFLAALPALGPGAPPSLTFCQEPLQGTAGPFTWHANEDLIPIVRPITQTAAAELLQIEAWLGVGPAVPGTLTWVADRASFERELGAESPSWFAAVTIPTQRRIVILADRSKATGQLNETFRHELVHWAMISLGQAGLDLPVWLHEGLAETWARTDPLSQFSSPLAWRAFRGDLAPLSRFRDAFGKEPSAAAEGYGLGYAFVRRLVRIHGDGVIAQIVGRLRLGDSLDASLIAVTGLGLVSHEEALRAELGSPAALLGEIYPQLFLFMALFALASTPFVIRARRRKRRLFEEKWAREEAAKLAEEAAAEDDRWIQPQ